MTAAGRFWLPYACGLVAAVMMALAWFSPARAAEPAATWPPGTRCVMVAPGRPHLVPQPVVIGGPLPMAGGPGYWIKADGPTWPDWVGVWMAPAAMLQGCRP